jgi:RNA polymerase sigma-70 factor (ECF subfamily)
MPSELTTCWTVIRAAAAGSAPDRDELARRYLFPVRTYLAARWQGSALIRDIDDAVQEVFVECFRPRGAVEAACVGEVPCFRAFLCGVARNVARRFEARRPEAVLPLGDADVAEESLSNLFDRAWAQTIMREAGERQRANAEAHSPEAVRRVELLRLRFEEGLAIRDIAERWDVDPAWLHHEYAQARKEFRQALLAVVAFHHPGSPDEVEREAQTLVQHFQ